MTETLRYLSILAKVMRNKNLPEEGQNKEKYNLKSRIILYTGE